MTDDSEVTIIIENGWPLLVILFFLVSLISLGIQILENARQRRKLAMVAGPNQEARQRGRMFFYTVLILGLLTLVANYITGITSSMAASHIDEVTEPIGLFSLPGLGFTLLTLVLYATAILVVAGLFLKNERIELPELLADLHDARKFGALDSPRQIAHYTAELDQLCQAREQDRAKRFTSGDFATYFTSMEQDDRPRLRQQLRYLRNHPQHRARTKYLHRRLFFNYRLAAGKWLVPLGLLAVMSCFFAMQELVAVRDGGPDRELAITWAIAGLLAIAAFASQYRCDLGKVLLRSRKDFIWDQTEAQCRSILHEATRFVPAPQRSSDHGQQRSSGSRC
ncbi:hypothetical protein ACX80E_05555 [Arthrobacter sp. TMN-49]